MVAISPEGQGQNSFMAKVDAVQSEATTTDLVVILAIDAAGCEGYAYVTVEPKTNPSPPSRNFRGGGKEGRDGAAACAAKRARGPAAG